MDKGRKYGIFARLALLTATIVWGSGFVVMKDALDGFHTYFILFFRFIVAGIILSIIFFKRLKNINKKYIIYGIIAGVFLTTAYAFQTFGLNYTTPGKNAFLTVVYCVIVPFLYWIVNKVRPDRYNIIAAIICFVGVGFVSLNEAFTIGLGDFLTLICGFCYAVHMIILAKGTRGRDPILITIIQFFTAAVLTLFLNIFLGEFPTMEVLSNGSILLELLYLAVFSTAIAMLCQSFGQKYTPPSQAAIIMTLESLFGVLFSVIFYGEVLTLQIIIGFILIFISMIISETKLSFIFDRKVKGKE